MSGLYLILFIFAIVLSLYAQIKVQTTFNKYLKENNNYGLTGADTARRLLDSNGLTNVQVEMVNGKLSDHYDPRDRVVRLSPEVYKGTSISSIGVSAHETGHAIQHQSGYAFLSLRSSLVPVANIGSWAAFPLILLGFFIRSAGLIGIGIIIYSIIVAFQVVTLPVEFNASNRALNMLSNGYLTSDEVNKTKKVLNAAALTYIAATAVAIIELLRLIFVFSSFSDD